MKLVSWLLLSGLALSLCAPGCVYPEFEWESEPGAGGSTPPGTGATGGGGTGGTDTGTGGTSTGTGTGSGTGSGNIDWSATPSYGSVSLNGGFSPDPYTVSIAAGGSQDASGLGAGCRGSIAGNPDFNLTFNPGSLPLTISASSSADTTLVINAPDGRWYCSDDYSGLNPAVEFANPQAGLYNIWVGTYADTSDLPPATLFISELGAKF